MNFDHLMVPPVVSAEAIALMDPRFQNGESETAVGTGAFAQPNHVSSFHAPKGQDPPKRCVSAYNLFFQVERQRLINNKTDQGPYTRAEVHAIKIDKATRVEKAKRPHRKMHGKISFTDLAKNIALKWKELDVSEKKLFEERAEEEKQKYAVELEEWLLRQVPTQQVRKRLSALRRGSLSKYITHRRDSLTTTPPTCTTPVASLTNTSGGSGSVHGISPYSSSGSLMSTSSRQHNVATVATAAAVTPDQGNHRQLQIQRARNLQRLYQMQISLYNEQMRIHDECKADMAALYKAQTPGSQEPTGLPPAPTSTDATETSSTWEDAMTPAFSSILPQYSLFNGDQYESSVSTGYVASPFHHDGRVSPFEQDTKVFA